MTQLNVHAIIRGSLVNGPGNRYTLWTQGCGKACKGCFNPETWAIKQNTLWAPEDLAQDVIYSKLDGLTLTGGDSLEQPAALLQFLKSLHESDDGLTCLPLGIICFTGYTVEEIAELPGENGEAVRACLPYFDLLIDGRYVEERKINDRLAGSSNQRFHYSELPGRGRARIGEDDVYIDQSVEIHLGGEYVQVTGFPEFSRDKLRSIGLKVVK